jgi:hypothetical protein
MEDQSQSRCDSRKTWKKKNSFRVTALNQVIYRAKKLTIKTSWLVRSTASEGVEIKTNGKGQAYDNTLLLKCGLF